MKQLQKKSSGKISSGVFLKQLNKVKGVYEAMTFFLITIITGSLMMIPFLKTFSKFRTHNVRRK